MGTQTSTTGFGNRPGWTPLVLATLLALLGVAIVLLSTRWGPILSDDSFSYLRLAMDILSGTDPNFRFAFPPLLQLIFAGAAIIGADLVPTFRYLNSTLFGISILLFGFAIYIATSSKLFFVIGSTLFLLSANLIRIYSEAMSEPLYLMFVILTAVALGFYGRNQKWYWLVIAALGAGAALGTRYVGVAAVTAAVATLLFRNIPKARRRWMEVFVVIVSAASLVGWYLALNLIDSGSLTNRGPFRIDNLLAAPSRQSVYGMLTWFIPGRVVRGLEYEAVVILAIVALTVGGICFIFWRTQTSRLLRIILQSLTFRFFAWFLIISLAVLFLSQGFVSLGDTFTERFVLPVYIAVLALILIILGTIQVRTTGARWVPPLVLALIIGIFFAYRSSTEVRYLYEEGAGYTSRRWHTSETVAYLLNHPDVPLISTAPKGVGYWTGVPVGGFSKNPEAVIQQVCESAGWLVLIDSMPPEFDGISTQKLIQPLELVQLFSEGSIYSCVD